MQHLLIALLACYAFGENAQVLENARLRKTNKLLLQTLKEVAVGGTTDWCAARCKSPTDDSYGCDCSGCGVYKSCGKKKEWICKVGVGGRSTGRVYRVDFEGCKDMFMSMGKPFMYYAGSKHCQEVSGYTGATNNNRDWQTCEYGEAQVGSRMTPECAAKCRDTYDMHSGCDCRGCASVTCTGGRNVVSVEVPRPSSYYNPDQFRGNNRGDVARETHVAQAGGAAGDVGGAAGDVVTSSCKRLVMSYNPKASKMKKTYQYCKVGDCMVGYDCANSVDACECYHPMTLEKMGTSCEAKDGQTC